MQYRYIKTFILLAVVGGLVSCQEQVQKRTIVEKPNIVIFYVDDLGYGDVGCYGAKGVQTPVVDRLAAQGLRMTDAHSGASTCTPSRYSLLTGRYAFRNQAAVLPGDAPLLIDTAQITLPKLLGRAGYRSAVVGKWHLGLGNGNIDWNGSVSPGPLEIGFDYSYLLPATGDRVPTVYLENHEVVNLDPNDPISVSYGAPIGDRPLGYEHPELLRYGADRQHGETIVNGISRIGYMAGGEEALWVDEEFPEVLNQKAINFIQESKGDPFFLFYSFHDIHVPRLPNEQFQGASTMGVRGDAIAQMDWTVGQILNEIERLGLAENTLVIFTSDNGPVLNDGYDDQAVELLGDHLPGGIYRGGKYSAFEAGTRVPTIVYWPGQVQPAVSEALFTQVDLMASLSALAGVQAADSELSDSQNQMEAMLGRSAQGRKYMLEEAYTMAIRSKDWKYIAPVPADKAYPAWLKDKDVEGGMDTIPQLYHVANDPSEQVNVAAQNPEVVAELTNELNELLKDNL
ncbi:Arylsulfatase A [Reichenbachiella agariperforans]|uniref:Arylsulfatase A n=1 Tax=Reichenbachiella agariperforans TaxID=156994 RepID=A0A1M6UKE9_REIAG|nr:arylsulfatase [Reichenbachiella agariperforans]SHK69692.1 Arylsulfatase A [Reichenbachiella agariperforans]